MTTMQAEARGKRNSTSQSNAHRFDCRTYRAPRSGNTRLWYESRVQQATRCRLPLLWRCASARRAGDWRGAPAIAGAPAVSPPPMADRSPRPAAGRSGDSDSLADAGPTRRDWGSPARTPSQSLRLTASHAARHGELGYRDQLSSWLIPRTRVKS